MMNSLIFEESQIDFYKAQSKFQSESWLIIGKFKLMKQTFMITQNINEPVPLTIRLCTQFQMSIFDKEQPSEQQLLARFYIYVKDRVYEGSLLGGNINSQLTWNEESKSAILESLNGKRSNIDIRFDQANKDMVLICEITTGINVSLFKSSFQQLENCHPFQHMRILFMGFTKRYKDQEDQCKLEKERIITEIKEINALENQIKDQTVTEISHMKKNFINIINACKLQLRKYMKTGIHEIIVEEDEEDEIRRTPRLIYKVSKEAIEKQSKDMNAIFDEASKEKLQKKRESENFQSLF